MMMTRGICSIALLAVLCSWLRTSSAGDTFVTKAGAKRQECETCGSSTEAAEKRCGTNMKCWPMKKSGMNTLQKCKCLVADKFPTSANMPYTFVDSNFSSGKRSLCEADMGSGDFQPRSFNESDC